MPSSDDSAPSSVPRSGSDCGTGRRTLSPISRTLGVLLFLGLLLLLGLRRRLLRLCLLLGLRRRRWWRLGCRVWHHLRSSRERRKRHNLYERIHWPPLGSAVSVCHASGVAYIHYGPRPTSRFVSLAPRG